MDYLRLNRKVVLKILDFLELSYQNLDVKELNNPAKFFFSRFHKSDRTKGESHILFIRNITVYDHVSIRKVVGKFRNESCIPKFLLLSKSFNFPPCECIKMVFVPREFGTTSRLFERRGKNFLRKLSLSFCDPRILFSLYSNFPVISELCVADSFIFPKDIGNREVMFAFPPSLTKLDIRFSEAINRNMNDPNSFGCRFVFNPEYNVERRIVKPVLKTLRWRIEPLQYSFVCLTLEVLIGSIDIIAKDGVKTIRNFELSFSDNFLRTKQNKLVLDLGIRNKIIKVLSKIPNLTRLTLNQSFGLNNWMDNLFLKHSTGSHLKIPTKHLLKMKFHFYQPVKSENNTSFLLFRPLPSQSDDDYIDNEQEEVEDNLENLEISLCNFPSFGNDFFIRSRFPHIFRKLKIASSQRNVGKFPRFVTELGALDRFEVDEVCFDGFTFSSQIFVMIHSNVQRIFFENCLFLDQEEHEKKEKDLVDVVISRSCIGFRNVKIISEKMKINVFKDIFGVSKVTSDYDDEEFHVKGMEVCKNETVLCLFGVVFSVKE